MQATCEAFPIVYISIWKNILWMNERQKKQHTIVLYYICENWNSYFTQIPF